jgi:predicted metal-dependent peptidase
LNKGSRSAGSGKGSRTRLLPDAIAKIVKPLVDWKAALKKYIGRILGDQREAVMPNRRFVSSGDFVYGSRRMKNKLKTCVVAVDVSGSIGFKELVVMINEVKGIAMQNRINDFEIVYFDHGIQHVEKLSGKEVVSYKPTAVGGGGTSFKEPLEYMNQINKKGDLDLAVFITDGYADLNLPVPNFKNKFIWVIIDHASFEAPFGSKIVHITVKEGK